MSLTAIDCQGYAGGFALGVVKAGFEVIAKREQPGGFGVPAFTGNAKMLQFTGDVQSAESSRWEVPSTRVDLVYGNPPCSGFSTLTDAPSRGVNAKVNRCMWDFWGYVARCRPAIAVMESVQQAFRAGRELMVRLRAHLERESGLQYNLIHVLHSCAQCGGAQRRHRYFMVASRVPFSVRCSKELPLVPTIREALADVDQAPDGHETLETAHTKRLHSLMAIQPWPVRTAMETVLAHAIDAGHGDHLISLGYDPFYLIKAGIFEGTSGGSSRFNVWRPSLDDVSPVIIGGSPSLLVHPEKNRLVTHRECARLMGFPDDWTARPYVEVKAGSTWWGKGVTVNTSRWIAEQVRAAMLNQVGTRPDEEFGEVIGDQEFLIDVTSRYIIPSSHGGKQTAEEGP